MSQRPTGTIKRQEQNLVSGPRTASEDLSARHVSESFICHKKHNHCVIIAASLVRQCAVTRGTHGWESSERWFFTRYALSDCGSRFVHTVYLHKLSITNQAPLNMAKFQMGGKMSKRNVLRLRFIT